MRGLVVTAALLFGACSMGSIGAQSSGKNPPGDQTPPPSRGGGGGSAGGPPAGEPRNVDGGVSSADGGAASDAVGAAPFCAQLVPVSAPSFQDLPAAPGSKLRVRVQPSDSKAAPATWEWTASYGDGAGVEVPVTTLDPQGSEVELPLEKPGRYQIAASAALKGTPCNVSTMAFATAADQRLGHFRVRITPASGPFPVQEAPVQARAGLPVVQALTVRQGQPVTFQPQDELGIRGVSAYVRVSQLGSSLAVEGHTARADFKPTLLGTFSYDVLFVPDEQIAPLLILGQTPAALNVLSQKLSLGAALTGTLRDAAGAPLKDGRVILRAGPLTSTVGKSLPGGDFALRVRAGQFAVTASPDPLSGLPELSLPADSGLTITDGPSAGALELKWAPINPAPVSLVIRTAGGVAPAAGARVRLERATPMAGAGTLVYTPDGAAPITRSIAGSVRLTGQVGADGGVSFLRVPPGSYRLLVTPADTDHASALTAVPLEVSAAGVNGQVVRLSARVKLRGRLLPAPGSADTRIYATPRDLDPPRPVAVATVAADGSYQLEVDPQRAYLVWADPGLGKPFARTQLAVVPSADGAVVPDRTLPRALAFSGVLAGEAPGMTIGGAVIQIFCDVAAASCLDPTITLGEGLSDGRGAFSLSLPDPGSF
jgi:hypothetical protein